MLGLCIRVASTKYETPIRRFCARGPDLLPIYDPFIAFELGTRLDIRKIGTRTGFGITLTPDLFAGENLGKKALFLFVASEMDQRRP